MENKTELNKLPTRRGRRMPGGDTLGETAVTFLFYTEGGADTTRIHGYLSMYYQRTFTRDSIRAMLGRLKRQGAVEKDHTEWHFPVGIDRDKARETIPNLNWHYHSSKNVYDYIARPAKKRARVDVRSSKTGRPHAST